MRWRGRAAIIGLRNLFVIQARPGQTSVSTCIASTTAKQTGQRTNTIGDAKSYTSMLKDAKLFKSYFDGSHHEDGSTCAGIVVYCSATDHNEFTRLCTISVPLSVQSACQAELAAMMLTLTLLQKLLNKTPRKEVEHQMRLLANCSIDALHARARRMNHSEVR